MLNALEKSNPVKRFYFKSSELEKVLLLSCLFSVAMTCARVIYTKELLFLSLIWNLFLACLPYYIACLVQSRPPWMKNKWVAGSVVALWLLFIPNSFYIITDLFHLKVTEAVPLWFDLALLFSFAWNGLLLGIASVRYVEKYIRQHIKLKYDLFFIYPVMLLNALGIYLGRYLRFNSWDVITNPFQLAHDIFNLLIHPVHYRFDWSMILCFSILMSFLYITLKKFSKSIL